MKCRIKAQSSGRIRVHAEISSMSLQEADILEYYLRNVSGVGTVKVYDRTCDAVIQYSGNRDDVIQALARFSFNDENAKALVPEHTSREESRYYQNRLISYIFRRYAKMLILPHDIRLAITICHAIGYAVEGLKALASRNLNVAVLDATAITASILQDDHDTASSVMFLLGIGDILEEWVRRKSISDLAGMMSLNVDKVWLCTEEGEGVQGGLFVEAAAVLIHDIVVHHVYADFLRIASVRGDQEGLDSLDLSFSFLRDLAVLPVLVDDILHVFVSAGVDPVEPGLAIAEVQVSDVDVHTLVGGEEDHHVEVGSPDETVVPACDIYLTSLYSEMRAKLEFRDMDDAETVTLELWDPETGARCATWDITEPALKDGAYSPPPFTTDLLYEAQADYYSAQNEFPMRCTLKAVIAYRDGDDTQSVEFSADSVEAIFWDVSYVPLSAERWSNWVTPGCFQLKVMDSPAEAQIVYGKGTPESDVDFFVTMNIDGQPVRVDPATRYTLHDEFDAKVYVPGEEELVDKHIHNTLLVIPMPEGFAEGEEHVATFTVRQYLPAYDAVVEFTQDVEF